jgi:hypothetical protein
MLPMHILPILKQSALVAIEWRSIFASSQAATLMCKQR